MMYHIFTIFWTLPFVIKYNTLTYPPLAFEIISSTYLLNFFVFLLVNPLTHLPYSALEMRRTQPEHGPDTGYKIQSRVRARAHAEI